MCRFSLICLFFGIPFFTYSQNYHFRQFTIDDGLPGTMLYRVFEDSKGYIWYLSTKGIARSDGNDVKHFTPRDGFHEAGAYHIIEDEAGVIWIISLNFKLYYFQDQRFHKVDTKDKIMWIDIDPDGEKWVMNGEGTCILRINRNKELETYYSMKSPEGMGTCVIKTTNGFLVAKGRTIEEIIPGKPITMLQHVDQYSSQMPPRFYRKRNHHILIAHEHGLFEYDPMEKRLVPLIHLGKNEILCFYEDPTNNNIWIGTTRGLLLFLGGKIHSGNQLLYLKEHGVASIIKTTTNNFLFASNAGAFACNFDSRHITKEEGLANEQVNFCKAQNGNIYLVSHSGQVSRYRNNRIEKFYDFSYRVFDVISTEDSLIVVTKGGYEAYAIDGEKVRNILKSNKLISRYGTPCRNNLYYADAAGNVYKHTRNKPELVYDSAKFLQLVAHHANENFHVAGDTTYCKIDGGFGIAWFLNSKLYLKSYKINGLISNIQKKGNQLIVCTYNNGLYVYTDHSVKHYTEKDILLSDYCSKTVIRNENIWLITKKGLMRFTLDRDGNIRNRSAFTTNNYLINNEVNDITFDKGNIYVATPGGVSIFKEDVKPRFRKPRLLIENIQVNNADTSYRQSYTLPYFKNNISLSLNSPGFGSHRQLLYKYVLNGNIVFTTSRHIQFSSLAPGSYELMFWVKGAEGVWSDPSDMITITIEPPFWKTWWFISLITFLIIIISGAFIYMLIKAIRRKNEFMRKTVENELRSLRLYMNPHFIFNSLTSLQSFVLTNQNHTANYYLAKFSKLIRSVMSYSVKGEIGLDEEIKLLEQYIELEMVRFKNQFEYAITVDEKITLNDLVIPSLLIQPFVENAIKHGLAGLDKKGRLQIHFYQKEMHFYCSIEDNGRGRWGLEPKTMKNHISSGIKFTEERIRLLIKQPGTEVVKITDLYAGSLPAGTRIDVLIPLINYHEAY